MSSFVAKTSPSGSKKLIGEFLRKHIIRGNMQLAYMAHQAADLLLSRDLQKHAIDRLFSRFSFFLLLYVTLCDCLG